MSDIFDKAFAQWRLDEKPKVPLTNNIKEEIDKLKQSKNLYKNNPDKIREINLHIWNLSQNLNSGLKSSNKVIKAQTSLKSVDKRLIQLSNALNSGNVSQIKWHYKKLKNIFPHESLVKKAKVFLQNNSEEYQHSNSLNNPINGIINSPYGWRVHPRLFRVLMHHGIDIPRSTGTKQFPVGKGKVTFSGRAGTYGNVVQYELENGIRVTHAHLSKILVKRGDILTNLKKPIGKTGSTGQSTGPHAHIEFLKLTNEVYRHAPFVSVKNGKGLSIDTMLELYPEQKDIIISLIKKNIYSVSKHRPQSHKDRKNKKIALRELNLQLNRLSGFQYKDEEVRGSKRNIYQELGVPYGSLDKIHELLKI